MMSGLFCYNINGLLKIKKLIIRKIARLIFAKKKPMLIAVLEISYVTVDEKSI